MGFRDLVRKLGFWSVVLRWREPIGFRVRLRGDGLLRFAAALGAWGAATGVLFILFGINSRPPHFLLAVALGAVFGLGPAMLLLFWRRDHVSGRVSVCQEGIRRQRHYADWSVDGMWVEKAEWPYQAISGCAIVPEQATGKSFSIMLLAVEDETEIVGLPRKIDLNQLSQFLASKRVPVQQAWSVPPQFTRRMSPIAPAIISAVGLVMLVGGAGFYAVKTADEGPAIAGLDQPEQDEHFVDSRLHDPVVQDTAPLDGVPQADSGGAPPSSQPDAAPGNTPFGFGGPRRPGLSPGAPPPAEANAPQPQFGKPTALAGGPGEFPFVLETSQRRPVIGFQYGSGSWAGKQAIGRLDPVFDRGQPPADMILAREGYAVGALNLDAGDYVFAIQVVFMRQKADGRLDPADSYTGDWFGHPTGATPTTLSGEGAPVIGILGFRGAVLNKVGLVLDSQ